MAGAAPVIAFWNSLHFIRPDWLWALLLLPAVLLGGWYRRRRRGDWRSAVDAHLLPHVLADGGRRARGRWLAVPVGLLLAVLALAGPSWRQVEQPLWESKTPLVVVLDLSSHTGAADLPPSRLLQVRAKLALLLRERRGGEVALVAYADEPFTVAPLTDDAANVALFLDALAPEVMPVDGQDAGKALEWAGSLLRQAGARDGAILLLSDRADAGAAAEAARLRAAGYPVSVLGLGTPAGAAYRDREGRIGHAWLDEPSLRALALAGGGRYARLSAGDSDLQALAVLQPQAAPGERAGRTGTAWQDEGYWLLPPLMLVALLAFRRRRQALAALALGLWLPLAMPAHAAERGGWWQRADQHEHQRLAEGVEAYRKGDFATAQRRFEGVDSEQGWYNLGNALARQGRYDEAIAAYDRALALRPGMDDAKANRAAVDAARRRKPPPGPQGGGQQNTPETQQGKSSPGQSQDGKSQDGKSQPPPSQAPSQQGQSPSQPKHAPPRPGQGQPAADTAPKAPQAEDARGQQQADRAQRERMAEALRRQPGGDGDPGKRAAQAAMSPQERERRQAIEAWMQRVPDEPGDLLKAKFQLEYERRRREGQ
ncbi:VWA domain-containing protein [Stenotrophomonas acidaminiphila]|uniref:vWA domain-containing protein n=1 Tax=Stenotrophomonas acidaminiphila TaxID=128780 RepID=UPI003D055D2C